LIMAITMVQKIMLADPEKTSHQHCKELQQQNSR